MIVQQEMELKNCPVCFIVYAAPVQLMNARRRDGEAFYCPNGHSLSFKDNENDRVRRERDRLKQENARLEDAVAAQRRNREAAERQAAAYKGQATKLRARVSNGVCACCNRSFANLRRHMETQHPTFKAEEGE